VVENFSKAVSQLLLEFLNSEMQFINFQK